MEFTARKDLGKKETHDQFNGKWLDETSYDDVVSSVHYFRVSTLKTDKKIWYRYRQIKVIQNFK